MRVAAFFSQRPVHPDRFVPSAAQQLYAGVVRFGAHPAVRLDGLAVRISQPVGHRERVAQKFQAVDGNRNFGGAVVCGKFRYLYRAFSSLEQLGHPCLAVPTAVQHQRQACESLCTPPYLGNDTADGRLSERAVLLFPAGSQKGRLIRKEFLSFVRWAPTNWNGGNCPSEADYGM